MPSSPCQSHDSPLKSHSEKARRQRQPKQQPRSFRTGAGPRKGRQRRLPQKMCSWLSSSVSANTPSPGVTGSGYIGRVNKGKPGKTSRENPSRRTVFPLCSTGGHPRIPASRRAVQRHDAQRTLVRGFLPTLFAKTCCCYGPILSSHSSYTRPSFMPPMR